MAVMKGDATCPDVLACSLFDTNPVHIISSVDENFKWTPINKKVYSKIEKKTLDMKFHCLNVIHMYNFGMGSVNVADKICMQYIPDHWIYDRKWWWSIFIWGLGGYATNVYLIYMEKNCQDKTKNMYRVPNYMSHLQFLKYMSTHIMTFKKRKSQQLRNKSVFAEGYVNQRSNYMPLPSFDSRISNQKMEGILDV